MILRSAANATPIATIMSQVNRAATSDAGRPAYLLVDPTLCNPLSELSELQELQAYSLPFHHPDLPDVSKPQLVILPSEENTRERLLQTVLQYSLNECTKVIPQGGPRARSICFVLFSSTEIDTLLANLASAAIAFDLQGSRRILRYWDPRVLQHWNNTPFLRQAFSMSSEDLLIGLNSFGDFFEISDPDISSERRKTGDSVRSLLADSEISTLLEVSRLNALAERIAPSNDMRMHDFWSSMREQLVLVGQLGLSDESDQLDFIVRRSLLNCRIEFSERIKKIIQAVRDLGISYASLDAEITDDEWLEIVSDCLSRKNLLNN